MEYKKVSLIFEKTKVLFFGNYNVIAELSIKIHCFPIKSVTEIYFFS